MTSLAQLWRPGVDAPLFPAELLNGTAGLSEIDPALRERVLDYLAAVVAARGPMHINVAWNALHYGWDLHTEAYTETLLNVDTLPRISVQSLETTPTGVIGTLPSETPVWVEVVHVEADDLTIDSDGDVPAARSGAPYDRNIRLRTVIDDAIFGPPEPEQRRVLDRLTRRRDLDQFGHLLSRNEPTDTNLAAEVASDPIQAYAHWLAVDPARLGGGPVPAALETSDPELTTPAIAASLHALKAIAETDPRLTVVGEHLCLAGRRPVLARDDLDDIIRQTLRVRRRQHRYTSAGGALRHLGAERPIRRTNYVAALTELTAALIDAASAGGGDPTTVRLRLDDSGRGGGVWRAVGAGGSDPGDDSDPLVPLGLGHAASFTPLELEATSDTVAATDVPDRPPPNAAVNTNAGTPTGSDKPDISDLLSRDDASTPLSPDEPASGRGDGLLGDLDITASHVTFTFALRTRHLTDGTMPVPLELHESHLSPATGPLAVRLGHEGAELAEDETFHEPVTLHDDPCQLRGLTWPLEFYPGLLLTATWTVGGRILDVTSERLPDPVSYAGIVLTHATDLTILAAHLGQATPDTATAQAAAGDHAQPAGDDTALDGDSPAAPGSGNTDEPAEDACGSGGPITDLEYGERDLADPGNRAYLALLLRAATRTIDPGPDGVRRFTAPVLVATAFAGLLVPMNAVGRAHRMLDAHAARGRLLRLPGEKQFRSASVGFQEEPPTYLWWPSGSRPPMHRPRTLLGPVVRRPHEVPVSLRRLPDGWEPSKEKVASWSQVHASLGPTYLPKNLPPGYTWVEAHERGSDPGWLSGAVRRR